MTKMHRLLRPHVYLLVVLIFAFLYVGLALTPSHYAEGLRLLGVENASPLLGVSRSIRSDEWIALTPLFQIAVQGDFSTVNTVSPYGESLKGFWALPIEDGSLFFKPQLWGFWVMPPAHAYSLYFLTLMLSMVLGYTILLRQLGASVALAVLGSVAIFCSHYVQVWWTSNAPVFAFAPWPLIVFLSDVRRRFKLPAMFWVSGIWLFGLVYPTFTVITAFVFAAAALAFRRDAFRVSNISVCVVGAGTAGALFYLYFGDLAQIMQATVYPGARVSSGGGIEWYRLFANLFPFFTTSQLTSLVTWTNDCEIAVFSTLIPLAIVFFADHRTIRINVWQLAVVATGLLLMLAWMILPVPSWAGRILLWNLVEPTRMPLGFGLLLTISLVVWASRATFILNGFRLLAFTAALIVTWVTSKVGFAEVWGENGQTSGQSLARSWFDLLPALIFGLALIAVKYLHAPQRLAVFAAATATGVLTFGTFNPIQSAYPIFDLPQTPLLTELRLRAKQDGVVLVPGMYGATINGAGIPAINQTLPVPQLAYFRKVFPEMPEDVFNNVFNRYAHIVPSTSITEPASPQPDVVEVPASAFTQRYVFETVDLFDAAFTTSDRGIVGNVDTAIARDGALYVKGWAYDSGSADRLSVYARIGEDIIAGTSAAGTRPDVERALNLPPLSLVAFELLVQGGCSPDETIEIVASTTTGRYAQIPTSAPLACPVTP